MRSDEVMKANYLDAVAGRPFDPPRSFTEFDRLKREAKIDQARRVQSWVDTCAARRITEEMLVAKLQAVDGGGRVIQVNTILMARLGKILLSPKQASVFAAAIGCSPSDIAPYVERLPWLEKHWQPDLRTGTHVGVALAGNPVKEAPPRSEVKPVLASRKSTLPPELLPPAEPKVAIVEDHLSPPADDPAATQMGERLVSAPPEEVHVQQSSDVIVAEREAPPANAGVAFFDDFAPVDRPRPVRTPRRPAALPTPPPAEGEGVVMSLSYVSGSRIRFFYRGKMAIWRAERMEQFLRGAADGDPVIDARSDGKMVLFHSDAVLPADLAPTVIRMMGEPAPKRSLLG